MPILRTLFNDILITLGVYSLSGREVTTATVAAVLTVLGYSIYDTIIVFDRIRENMPLMPRAKFATIANISLWQTMRRSLATTFITLLPIVSLLLFGGATLKDFAFALFVGIGLGAISTFFVATPFLTVLMERSTEFKRRIETEDEGVGAERERRRRARPSPSRRRRSSGPHRSPRRPRPPSLRMHRPSAATGRRRSRRRSASAAVSGAGRDRMAEPDRPDRDALERLALAAVGVVALTADRVEELANDLTERGGMRRDEARQLLEDAVTRWRGDATRLGERAGESLQRDRPPARPRHPRGDGGARAPGRPARAPPAARRAAARGSRTAGLGVLAVLAGFSCTCVQH